MTCTEFLESMKIRGAKIAPGTQPTDIAKINMGLQSIKAAILPKFMTDIQNLAALYLIADIYLAHKKSQMAQTHRCPAY